MKRLTSLCLVAGIGLASVVSHAEDIRIEVDILEAGIEADVDETNSNVIHGLWLTFQETTNNAGIGWTV